VVDAPDSHFIFWGLSMKTKSRMQMARSEQGGGVCGLIAAAIQIRNL
jgi:hypothetical protein